GAKGLAEHF
nr:toxin peptide 4a beta [Bombina variegata]